jgi:hypothetical protein
MRPTEGKSAGRHPPNILWSERPPSRVRIILFIAYAWAMAFVMIYNIPVLAFAKATHNDLSQPVLREIMYLLCILEASVPIVCLTTLRFDQGGHAVTLHWRRPTMFRRLFPVAAAAFILMNLAVLVTL